MTGGNQEIHFFESWGWNNWGHPVGDPAVVGNGEQWKQWPETAIGASPPLRHYTTVILPNGNMQEWIDGVLQTCATGQTNRVPAAGRCRTR